MHETVSSLLITLVAVAGTLVSTLLAQRQVRRSRAQELSRLDRRRRIEAKRARYTALNTAARRYLVALTNQFHALRANEGVESVTAELHRARAAHADCYAELQLIAPPAVLAAARRANRSLNHTFGLLMRLTNGTCLAGDSLDAAQARISALWEVELAGLRRQMRLDLDLDPASPAGSPAAP
ncbi:hypothetical protein [Streptomyces hoynatensis]|uniref:Uncharacterized protein n=1 Tax=Streptomyces hoynatensis TaxID=1141874 RepID=A0A3A9ZER8_9ACTN|nr:hypothetical protein [Streptomyces hoynatensis]RKN46689.1 hypothetical protein D7294_00170 [Streptomyces hoynatensis]